MFDPKVEKVIDDYTTGNGAFSPEFRNCSYECRADQRRLVLSNGAFVDKVGEVVVILE